MKRKILTTLLLLTGLAFSQESTSSLSLNSGHGKNINLLGVKYSEQGAIDPQGLLGSGVFESEFGGMRVRNGNETASQLYYDNKVGVSFIGITLKGEFEKNAYDINRVKDNSVTVGLGSWAILDKESKLNDAFSIGYKTGNVKIQALFDDGSSQVVYVNEERLRSHGVSIDLRDNYKKFSYDLSYDFVSLYDFQALSHGFLAERVNVGKKRTLKLDSRYRINSRFYAGVGVELSKLVHNNKALNRKMINASVIINL